MLEINVGFEMETLIINIFFSKMILGKNIPLSKVN